MNESYDSNTIWLVLVTLILLGPSALVLAYLLLQSFQQKRKEKELRQREAELSRIEKKESTPQLSQPRPWKGRDYPRSRSTDSFNDDGGASTLPLLHAAISTHDSGWSSHDSASSSSYSSCDYSSSDSGSSCDGGGGGD